MNSPRVLDVWRCPRCLEEELESGLELTSAEELRDGRAWSGILTCSHAACRREYPVIDGVPFLLANIPDFAAQQGDTWLQRHDLPPLLTSLVGDALGPSHAFEVRRKQLSTYIREHFGNQDPDDDGRPVPAGSLLELTDTLLAMATPEIDGPLLDVGCGPGGTSHALARAFPERTVLGLDYHAALIGAAERIRAAGRVRYDRSHVGIVYHPHDFSIDKTGLDRVWFAGVDATHAPLPDAVCAGILCLNVIDSTSSPASLLTRLVDLLKPGGVLWLCSPYDWAEKATTAPQWIGGHSQRSESRGDSGKMLADWLVQPTGAGGLGLERIAEKDETPWNLRIHARSTMQYQTHTLALRKPVE